MAMDNTENVVKQQNEQITIKIQPALEIGEVSEEEKVVDFGKTESLGIDDRI